MSDTPPSDKEGTRALSHRVESPPKKVSDTFFNPLSLDYQYIKEQNRRKKVSDTFFLTFFASLPRAPRPR